jgi:hypothetical protein
MDKEEVRRIRELMQPYIDAVIQQTDLLARTSEDYDAIMQLLLAKAQQYISTESDGQWPGAVFLVSDDDSIPVCLVLAGMNRQDMERTERILSRVHLVMDHLAAVYLVGEAWARDVALADTAGPMVRPSEAPDRYEIVAVAAMHRVHGSRALVATTRRDEAGRARWPDPPVQALDPDPPPPIRGVQFVTQGPITMPPRESQ